MYFFDLLDPFVQVKEHLSLVFFIFLHDTEWRLQLYIYTTVTQGLEIGNICAEFFQEQTNSLIGFLLILFTMFTLSL